MRPLMSSLIGVAAMALVGAHAVAAPPSPPRAPDAPVLLQVFLSPSGEPFRAPRGAPYPVANWFAGADRNGDGKLTASEFAADFGRFFDTLDGDHDQNITDPEIRHYEAVVAPEVRSGVYAGPPPKVLTGNDGKSGGDETSEENRAHNAPYVVPAGGASYGLLAIPEPVTGMDSNFNGVVTREEALISAQRRFRLLDREHRGYLTLADLPRTQVQGHGGRLPRY